MNTFLGLENGWQAISFSIRIAYSGWGIDDVRRYLGVGIVRVYPSETISHVNAVLCLSF